MKKTGPVTKLCHHIVEAVLVAAGLAWRFVRLVEGFGWRLGVVVMVRRLLGIGIALSEVSWPGYLEPFLIRSGDWQTFFHVIADDGYDFPYVGDASTIIDAGANVGFASIWYATRFPKAKIVALEPDSANFALLQRNVAAYANITPVRGALWKENGSIVLTDPGVGPDGYRTASASDVPAEAQSLGEVDAYTVDALMDRFGFDHVDILKVDVEGAEVEVFERPQPWMWKIGAIAIELHDRFRSGCSRAFYRATEGQFGFEQIRGEDTFVRRAAA